MKRCRLPPPAVTCAAEVKDLTTAQRPLAHALLSSGLSQRGYASAVTIMSLEQILLEQEQGKGPQARSGKLFRLDLRQARLRAARGAGASRDIICR
jgi:hypothetical protein